MVKLKNDNAINLDNDDVDNDNNVYNRCNTTMMKE